MDNETDSDSGSDSGSDSAGDEEKFDFENWELSDMLNFCRTCGIDISDIDHSVANYTKILKEKGKKPKRVTKKGKELLHKLLLHRLQMLQPAEDSNQAKALGAHQQWYADECENLRLLITTLKKNINRLPPTLDVQGIADTVSKLERVEGSLGRTECPIMVFGDTSSGKSSLLNLLLHDSGLESQVDQFLHTSPSAASSTVCKVKYAEQSHVLARKWNGDKIDMPLDVTNSIAEQVKHLAAEDRGNLSNQSGKPTYESVEVTLPLEILKHGAVFFDTPGLSEAVTAKDGDGRNWFVESVERILPMVASTICVVNCNCGTITTETQMMLEKIIERPGFRPDSIFFVLTKMDTINEFSKRAELLSNLKSQLVMIARGADFHQIFEVNVASSLDLARHGLQSPEFLEVHRQLVTYFESAFAQSLLNAVAVAGPFADKVCNAINRRIVDANREKKEQEEKNDKLKVDLLHCRKEFAARRSQIVDFSKTAHKDVRGEFSRFAEQRRNVMKIDLIALLKEDLFSPDSSVLGNFVRRHFKIIHKAATESRNYTNTYRTDIIEKARAMTREITSNVVDIDRKYFGYIQEADFKTNQAWETAYFVDPNRAKATAWEKFVDYFERYFMGHSSLTEILSERILDSITSGKSLDELVHCFVGDYEKLAIETTDAVDGFLEFRLKDLEHQDLTPDDMNIISAVLKPLEDLVKKFQSFEGRIAAHVDAEQASEELQIVDSSYFADNFKEFHGDIRPPVNPKDLYLRSGNLYGLTLKDDHPLKGQVLDSLGDLPPNFEVTKIEVVFNSTQSLTFYSEIEKCERRMQDKSFQPSLHLEDEQKTRGNVLEACKAKCSLVKHNRDVDIMRAWHGTSKGRAEGILSNGFAALSKLDAGYFGKGIYLTGSAAYALKYSTEPHVLLMCHAIVLNPFPVIWTDSPRDRKPHRFRFYGKGNHRNYQSHYVPVTTRAHDFTPPHPDEEGEFDELVVFQESYILPQIVVHLNKH